MAKTELVTDESAQKVQSILGVQSCVTQSGALITDDEVSQFLSDGSATTMNVIREDEPDAAANAAGTVLDSVGSMATFFAEYKIISGLTKADKSVFKSALAFAATGMLRAMHVLPSSLGPVVQAVAGAVGTDSLAGTALNGLAGVLPSDHDREELAKTVATITEGDDYLERDGSDRTMASADTRVTAIYNMKFGPGDMLASTADTSMEDLNEYMSANGKLMAEDNVFLSCANKAETDREFANMRMTTTLSCGALEADLEASGGASAKKDAGVYVKLAEGLAAYEAGAREGFREAYAGDPARMAQAEDGLSKVMEATRGPVAESIKSVQEQYGLFTEDEMARFREVLPGFDDDLFTYDVTDQLSDAILENDDLMAAYLPDESVLNAHKETGKQAEAPAPAQAERSVPRTGLDLSRIQADKDSPEYQPRI